MCYFVIETEFGYVISIREFEDFLRAEEYAESLCEEEGIDYDGDVSYDLIYEYSVQIVSRD